jgi:pimeloyl-ACP methyl ester carboxylesterase
VKLEADRGGAGPRLLVLLHGLGATRQVWTPLLAANRWTGRWIAPDLRGHGASPHAADYSLDAHAGDVAELLHAAGRGSDVVMLGHSMGGVVALALASGTFGTAPARVFGLGIKVAWSDEERAGMRKMAATPARTFESRDEAVARYLKVSGLAGLFAADSPEALSGVAARGTGWRLACDPATALIGPPPMEALMAGAKAPVHLARGQTDAMVSREQLAVYDRHAHQIAGGHNAMVENPTAIWDWIDETLP